MGRDVQPLVSESRKHTEAEERRCGRRSFAGPPGRQHRKRDERSGERRAVSSDILTAQELQIAQLAADGLTNRDIGKRLYISHRTVGAHLAKIYAKLGATSRVQLHSALSPEPHDGHLLIFGVGRPRTSDSLPPFLPTNETSERLVVREPMELVFPLHTRVLREFLASKPAWQG